MGIKLSKGEVVGCLDSPLLCKATRVASMPIPAQASWMVRKVLGMRKYWPQLGDATRLVHEGKFLISKAYSLLRGVVPRVEWKHLVCHNCAEPRQPSIFFF